MNVISHEAMFYGSESVFYNWSGFEIPVRNLNMAETEDVVERFSKEAAQHGPMRSYSAQVAADMVQRLVEIAPREITVGAVEKSGTTMRHYWESRVPSTTVAVLADISISAFNDAIYHS